VIDHGVAWGATVQVDQDGGVYPACARSALIRAEAELADMGMAALVGHEVEFVVVRPDGGPLEGSHWTPYGVSGLLDHRALLQDFVDTARASGLGLEQVHAEYGPHQFEFSLPPATPVAAADALLCSRIMLGSVARRHGVQVSVSPVAFASGVGNGAHQHLSLTHHGVPIFAGGEGAHGITTMGRHAIGGIVSSLPAVQGLLTGSIISGLRLAPGAWSGSHVAWGLENREAAVRFVMGGPANPHGANIEVKCIDSSANVYAATATILGAMLLGIRQETPLPPELTDDPVGDASAAVEMLATDAVAITDALEQSHLARQVLSDMYIDSLVASRRYEQRVFGSLSHHDLVEQLRLTWST